MSTLAHSAQVPVLMVANIVVGFVLVKGIVNLVAKLTEDAPSFLFVGVPATVLVTASSLAVWVLATV